MSKLLHLDGPYGAIVDGDRRQDMRVYPRVLYRTREGYDGWSDWRLQPLSYTRRGHEAGETYTLIPCAPPPEASEPEVARETEGRQWYLATIPEWCRSWDGAVRWEWRQQHIML